MISLPMPSAADLQSAHQAFMRVQSALGCSIEQAMLTIEHLGVLCAKGIIAPTVAATEENVDGPSFAEIQKTKIEAQKLRDSLRGKINERQVDLWKIARANYLNGLFYMAAELVADKLDCSKSTAQLDIAHLEDCGVWKTCTVINPKTGRMMNAKTFTPFAPQALRIIEEEEKIAIESAKKSALEKPRKIRVSSKKKANNRPDNTTCSKDTTYPKKPEVSLSLVTGYLYNYATNNTHACAREEKIDEAEKVAPPVVVDIEKKKNDDGETATAAGNAKVVARTARLTGREEVKSEVRAVEPSAEAAQAAVVETPETTMRAMLVEAGMTDGVAGRMLREFSLDRIARNAALPGLGDAENPGAWLVSAIRQDWARNESQTPGNRRGTYRERSREFGTPLGQLREIEARESAAARNEAEHRRQREEERKWAAAQAPAKPVTTGTFGAESPAAGVRIASLAASVVGGGEKAMKTPEKSVESGPRSEGELAPQKLKTPTMADVDKLPAEEKAALRERVITELRAKYAEYGGFLDPNARGFENMVGQRMLHALREAAKNIANTA